jgi:hypothetical protein
MTSDDDSEWPPIALHPRTRAKVHDLLLRELRAAVTRGACPTELRAAAAHLRKEAERGSAAGDPAEHGARPAGRSPHA